jgi:hypothetical protein
MQFSKVYRCLAGDVSDIWEVGFQTSAEGETLTLATLDSNFTCRVSVPGLAIDRAVSVKNGANDRFIVALTEAETTLLGKGDHIVHLKISNATLSPPLAKTKQVLLRVG